MIICGGLGYSGFFSGSIADNLPEWDENNCEEASFTQLSAISCESNKFMKKISPWPVEMGEKYFWVYKVMCCPLPTVVKNEESINEI